MATGRRILFLGTHGQYNIGDELLLETFLRRLGAHHSYHVNSYDPAFTAHQLGGRYQAEIFDTAGSRLSFARKIMGVDAVVFGGGSIIKELYASVGRHPHSTLRMILLTVFFARQVARKPVLMSNIGVGPLLSPGGARLTRLILGQVDYLAVRDAQSHATCIALGVPASRMRQVPDAVFSLDPKDLGVHLCAPREVNGPLRVALNLNFNIENPNNWESFLATLAAGLRAFAAQRPLEIHGLPMQMGFKAHDDAQELAAFRSRIPELEVVLHQPQNHREVAAILANCDLVVAERLHALILAAILGRPCLPLAYDVKVRELAKALGLSDYALDINQPITPDALTQRLVRLEQNRRDVHTHLSLRAASYRSELDEYFRFVQEWLNRPGAPAMQSF